MNKNDRIALAIFLALILLGVAFWGLRSRGNNNLPREVIPTPTSTAPVAPPPPAAPVAIPAPAPVVPKPVKKMPAVKKEVPTSDVSVPTPPKLELHRELIPKDITIVRCYSSQHVVPPGETTGFDINGSGFNSEFQKMIKIDANQAGIHVKNLKLITPNQIHGEMEVGADAKTAFVFPSVLIKNLPVFTAEEPFAVIRPNEVLTIFFIQMQDNGRGGRFRVLTNMTAESANQFKIQPSTPGLAISDIQMRLPYAVEGAIEIQPGVPTGDYGLNVSIGGKEVFRRNGMIRIVRPNVGASGLVHGIAAEEPYRRPGDVVQLYLQGTGLSPNEALSLVASVKEFDMGRGSFTYLSPAQMRFTFNVPKNAPEGAYTIGIKNPAGESIFEKKDSFSVVGANWLAGVQVSPPVHAGGKSTIKIVGRDLSPEFLQQFRIETDESGITIGSPHAVNATLLEAEISVSSAVASGDYWLHLSANKKKISPPFGSIIKVEP